MTEPLENRYSFGVAASQVSKTRRINDSNELIVVGATVCCCQDNIRSDECARTCQAFVVIEQCHHVGITSWIRLLAIDDATLKDVVGLELHDEWVLMCNCMCVCVCVFGKGNERTLVM